MPWIKAGLDDTFGDRDRKLRARHDDRLRAKHPHHVGGEVRLHMHFEVSNILDRPHRSTGVDHRTVGTRKADCIKVPELVLQIRRGEIGKRSRTYERTARREKWQFERLNPGKSTRREARSGPDDIGRTVARLIE